MSFLANDPDLLTLCVLLEAGSECDDGRAGVARVIKNRMAKKFESDGTIAGTVLAYDQFSWAWFAFRNVHTGTAAHAHTSSSYVRVAKTLDQATAIATGKLARLQNTDGFKACGAIASAVMAGTYRGPLYDKLDDEALMYLNPDILEDIPAWASADKFEEAIEHHKFYRA